MSGQAVQAVGFIFCSLSLVSASAIVYYTILAEFSGKQTSLAQTQYDQFILRQQEFGYQVACEDLFVLCLGTLLIGIDLAVIGRNAFVDLASVTVDNVLMFVFTLITALYGLCWVDPRQMARARRRVTILLSTGVVSLLWAFLVASLVIHVRGELRSNIGGLIVLGFIVIAFISLANYGWYALSHRGRNRW